MAASTRFLSAVAFAFVAGVTSTSVYMSRGDARRDVRGASHEAAPSLSERLRAEANGQSLPWSDPAKAAAATPASPKLRFTPGPADAPVEGAKSVTEGNRSTVLQMTPAPTPVRPPEEGRERPRIRLADRSRRARPEQSVVPDVGRSRPEPLKALQHALDEEGRHPRSRVAEAARPATKLHSAPPRNLPSLDAIAEARLDARRPELNRGRLPAASPYRSVRLASRNDLDVDALPPSRTRKANVEALHRSSEDELRAGSRGRVAASDGLMRWLSEPDSRF